ncbi:MAG: NADH-quinone oxidoreductase subunit J [Phycisphaerae bacterium]
MITEWTLMVYATFALGALAVYFLLPRTGRSTTMAGAILGVAALAAAMVLCASKFRGSGGGNLVFYMSAVVAVGSAVKVITHKKPLYSALYFVLTVIAVTPLLILQEAEFLAIALVIIYAGAILVTYVFVIMLAQQGGQPLYDRRAREPLVAVLGGFLTMAVIAGQMALLPEERASTGELTASTAASTTAADDIDIDNTRQVGRVMMTDYVVAFELAGVLLLIAMVGAIAMSQKRVPSAAFEAEPQPPGKAGREAAPF